MLRWVRSLVALGCLAAACQSGSSGPPSPPPQAKTPAPAAELVPLPLSHDALPLMRSLQGKPFPPLLRVMVNGHDTWMVVDSGATYHALAGWFVREIDPNRTATDGVRDDPRANLPTFEGATITAGRSIISLRARLPIISVPPALRELGVGGFLSPGFLFPPGGAVVVDLRGNRLRSFAHAADAVAFTGGAGKHAWSAPACTTPDQPAFRRYVVEAQVNGSPARLEVDTGAGSSYLFSGSPAGKVLSATTSKTSALLGVDGVQKAARLGDVHLAIGGINRTLPVLLTADTSSGRSNPCPYDGVVAMDVLARCVIVLTDRSATVQCEP